MKSWYLKGKKSNIYPAFPKHTVPLDKQIVDRYLFLEVFQLISKEGTIECKQPYYTVLIPTEQSWH